MLQQYKQRKRDGYFEPLRPVTRAEADRDMRSLVYQLTEAMCTGRPPAFWSKLRGTQDQNRPVKPFADLLEEQSRKLDVLEAAIKRVGHLAGNFFWLHSSVSV